MRPKIKRMLVGLAGTTYSPVAIQRAVALEQAHDAEVTGVTVLDSRYLSKLGKAAPQWENADSIHDRRLAITVAHIDWRRRHCGRLT